MTLKDRIEQKLPHHEDHRLRRENRELRSQLAEALERADRGSAADSLFVAATGGNINMPDWTLPKRSGKGRTAIPVHLFSDWHLNEWVDYKQTNGRNQYSRAIAEKRLKRNFTKVAEVCRDYVSGFQYPGIVVGMLGDNFSGNIHEELKNTNEDTLLGSLLHWLEPIAAGLRLLADEFGRVTVVGVVGNHGRSTHKPIAKGRVRDNFDWLLCKLLEREFTKRGDKRFTWIIGESHKQPFTVLNTKFLASHGDEAKGGSGIAGLLSPLMIAAARIKKIHDFDYWVIGHWHNRSAFRNVRVNGTGKGWDEYSALMSFDFQPPQQDLFFVTPERGITCDFPIYLDDK